ncbi:MAG: transglutaminase-like domain-containing protein [Planctomycetota bacterium]
MRRVIIAAVWSLPVFFAGQGDAQAGDAGELITRSEPLAWRLKTAVTLGSRIDQPLEVFHGCSSDPAAAGTVQFGEAEVRGDGAVARFDIEEATVYFPVADRAASYTVDRESLSAEFLYQGDRIPIQGSLFASDASGQPLHSGGAYGIWRFGPARGFVPSLTLQFEFEARTWNIALDEAAAREIRWPQGDWPVAAARSLEPMLFVDRAFDGELRRDAFQRIVEQWTAGKPRSQPPLVTAKWIAGQLSNSFQPIGSLTSRDSIAANSVQPGRSLGALQALNATRLDDAAETMVGTPMDLPLLLTALYREAGLPARVVVGYVAGDEGGGRDLVRRSDEPELGVYAWVEFALYDETNPSLERALAWIPVDIVAMRAGNVGRRPLDQSWDGFGRGEYFNELIPIGYHLHPHELPAISYGVADASSRLRRMRHGLPVRSPGPSLWGWNVVPVTPSLLHQTIVFSATTPSRRGEDDRRDRPERGR